MRPNKQWRKGSGFFSCKNVFNLLVSSKSMAHWGIYIFFFVGKIDRTALLGFLMKRKYVFRKATEVPPPKKKNRNAINSFDKKKKKNFSPWWPHSARRLVPVQSMRIQIPNPLSPQNHYVRAPCPHKLTLDQSCYLVNGRVMLMNGSKSQTDTYHTYKNGLLLVIKNLNCCRFLFSGRTCVLYI